MDSQLYNLHGEQAAPCKHQCYSAVRQIVTKMMGVTQLGHFLNTSTD